MSMYDQLFHVIPVNLPVISISHHISQWDISPIKDILGNDIARPFVLFTTVKRAHYKIISRTRSHKKKE